VARDISTLSRFIVTDSRLYV